MEILGFPTGPYKTNCYMWINDGKCVVIDPGMHAHDIVVKHVEENDLKVEAVVLTHGHFDHTRDAGQLAKRYRVPVYIHQEDAIMLSHDRSIADQTWTLFDLSNMVPITDLRHFEHGQMIELAGADFEIRHTPGHSPGSVLLINKESEFIFGGDVLFKGSIGRTDLEGCDPEAMNKTLREQILTLDDTYTVLPGHGPATTIRNERVSNPFLQNLN